MNTNPPTISSVATSLKAVKDQLNKVQIVGYDSAVALVVSINTINKVIEQLEQPCCPPVVHQVD